MFKVLLDEDESWLLFLWLVVNGCVLCVYLVMYKVVFEVFILYIVWVIRLRICIRNVCENWW